mmetsp:Transcript_9072/g.25438  ORF Transcript_9072/g.25438 Transcript_9072/m.25438 type:complete len:232 (+) Transcript_9072:459-1154(+)
MGPPRFGRFLLWRQHRRMALVPRKASKAHRTVRFQLLHELDQGHRLRRGHAAAVMPNVDLHHELQRGGDLPLGHRIAELPDIGRVVHVHLEPADALGQQGQLLDLGRGHHLVRDVNVIVALLGELLRFLHRQYEHALSAELLRQLAGERRTFVSLASGPPGDPVRRKALPHQPGVVLKRVQVHHVAGRLQRFHGLAHAGVVVSDVPPKLLQHRYAMPPLTPLGQLYPLPPG